ncbi:MAG: lasso peptide biosynthesis B2 protein [Gemmatimonadaceae bacterium]
MTLGPRDWAELAQAQGALICAQVLVWMRPTGRLVSSDQTPRDHIAPATGTAAAAPVMDPRAPRLALAVGRAAENGLFRPLCLVQAVALHRMLEHRDIPGSRIRIGVRMRNGRFAAHAWVEYHGQVLGDPAEIARGFDDLTGVHLLDAP